jgi:hypothetical protein
MNWVGGREVFLAAAEASRPRGGGGNGLPHHGGGHNTAGGACAYADGGGARVDVGASRARVYTRPKGGLCGGTDVNREDKM